MATQTAQEGFLCWLDCCISVSHFFFTGSVYPLDGLNTMGNFLGILSLSPVYHPACVFLLFCKGLHIANCVLAILEVVGVVESMSCNPQPYMHQEQNLPRIKCSEKLKKKNKTS